ncbi:MAG TPA: YkgJ family cysteine cluster protein [Xanthobacteraceae bacterium]|nr:YkgJ family cysteine cluster protein [Xanthobacteraceae bacterium]
MTDPRQQSPTISLQLRILGEPVTVEAPQPPERVRLDEVLPLLRKIDDHAVGLAVQRTEAEGKTVSCRKGCAACCRVQPVPVTPPEAYALLRLVENLPEQRRAEVRDRFADRVRRLRDAGLADHFLQLEGDHVEQVRDAARRYMRLGLVCPFLEDDACSIYEDRPFVCREYLVTSPAERCRDPFTTTVEGIQMPVAGQGAMLRTATKFLEKPQFSVALTLALEYAEAHRPELEREFASPDVFLRAVQELTRTGASRLKVPTARIGLIIPSVNRLSEPQFVHFAPPGLGIHVTRARIAGKWRQPVSELAPIIAEAAAALSDASPDLIIYHCTDSSMREGLDGERRILDIVKRETGIEAVSTSALVVEALNALGIKKLVIVSPYRDNDVIIAYLQSCGFSVVHDVALRLQGHDSSGATPERWVEATLDNAREEADGYFLSCTNTTQIEAIRELEGALAKPVVSSNQAVLWGAVKRLRPRLGEVAMPRLGRLMEL